MNIKPFLLALTALPFSLAHSGAADVLSTFDTDREGWIPGFGAAVGSGAVWQSTGGNPGGRLFAPDRSDTPADLTWYFSATPGDGSPLLGGHSDAYGGILSYDAIIPSPGGAFYSDADVYLRNSSVTLFYVGGFLPGASWATFTVPLRASAGWRKGFAFNQNSVAATEADMQAALANLQEVDIRGNYDTAVNGSGLDNVGITTAPEPTSAALLLGSGAMLLLRRRRAAAR